MVPAPQTEDVEMLSTILKAASVAMLPLVALATAVPAEARDRYHDRGGDDAAIAIGAGVVGLALGAAIASSDRDRDYYYDDGYYPRGGYYVRTYPRYYGHPAYRYREPRHYYRRDWRGHGWRGDGWRHRERRWRY